MLNNALVSLLAHIGFSGLPALLFDIAMIAATVLILALMRKRIAAEIRSGKPMSVHYALGLSEQHEEAVAQWPRPCPFAIAFSGALRITVLAIFLAISCYFNFS
ncbi:MAG: hypothetical protein FWF71_02010 [Actinomycetia bacterium]|nr:hypothetical protein [Actinomycetes bacterium]